MSRAVRLALRVLFGISCLENLRRTGLLGRGVATSDFDDSVEKAEAQCSVESSTVMTVESVFVWDDTEVV